jgi:hypothetical protein
VPTPDRLAELLREQGGYCAALGSPLYAALLERASKDAGARGPTYALLEDDPSPGPRGDALALRLLAAAHSLALQGRAPDLARHLPSTQPEGSASPLDAEGAWRALRELIATSGQELKALVALPCQTNEVGRAAALAYGFFEAARAGLPLRLLEVGAGAGLNLRFDHFHYAGGGAAWGPVSSPVLLDGLWLDPPPLPDALRVVERSGCDRRPLDATTHEGRLSLLSSVWADQTPRFARLRGAIDIAARVPVRLDAADLTEWLPERLEVAAPGRATVVYHSIVDEYLTEAARRRFHAALQAGGARAMPGAPLFWLRLEPLPDQVRFAVTLTRWPGADERILAYAGAHGTDVRRA